MASLRLHVDHLGVERIEILPEKGTLPAEAFELAGQLGETIRALDREIRKHFLGSPGGQQARRPSARRPKVVAAAGEVR